MKTTSEKEELLSVLKGLKRTLKDKLESGVPALPKRDSLKSIKEESPISGEIPMDSFSISSELVDLNFDQLREMALKCQKCSLCQTRKNVVFGTGNPKADLMFVGEAPGNDEDIQGLPFVGRAGQLLTKIIQAMGFEREDVYIANVLKCRPPNNRPPKPEEVKECEPYLLTQIKHIQPKIIVALGTHAAQTLLKTDKKISGMRGVFHDYHGVSLMPTYHPAYLLRSPSEKKKVWEDMQIVMKSLGKPIPKE